MWKYLLIALILPVCASAQDWQDKPINQWAIERAPALKYLRPGQSIYAPPIYDRRQTQTQWIYNDDGTTDRLVTYPGGARIYREDGSTGRLSSPRQ